MSLHHFDTSSLVEAYSRLGEKLIEKAKEDLNNITPTLKSSDISHSSGRLRKAVQEAQNELDDQCRSLSRILREAISALHIQFEAATEKLKEKEGSITLEGRSLVSLRKKIREEVFLFTTTEILPGKSQHKSWSSSTAFGAMESLESQDAFLEELHSDEMRKKLVEYGITAAPHVIENLCLATRNLLVPLVNTTRDGTRSYLATLPSAPKKKPQQEREPKAAPRSQKTQQQSSSDASKGLKRKLPTASEIAMKKTRENDGRKRDILL